MDKSFKQMRNGSGLVNGAGQPVTTNRLDPIDPLKLDGVLRDHQAHIRFLMTSAVAQNRWNLGFVVALLVVAALGVWF